MKAIVVSLPRSGTTSICRMAHMLNLRPLHVSHRWRRDLANYDLFADTPFYCPSVITHLAKRADTRFIYLIRPPQHLFFSWCKSGLAEHYARLLQGWRQTDGWHFDRKYYGEAFGYRPFTLRDHELQVRHHLKAVISVLSLAGMPLLVYQFDQGWKPLCDFLSLPTPPPDVQIPHLNRGRIGDSVYG